MSDALLPWIRDYLISIAETHGANIANLPLYPKNKKVQLIQFLTYGSEHEDTLIWAEISDKQYIIPVKFTKEAVADYRRTHPGQRLTRHKGGIFRITGFRPISTRVPRTNDTLSAEPSLVLECTSLTALGSSGEATFGCPDFILNEPDIRLWNEGLKKDGGAGNVLKDRKEQRETNKRHSPPAVDPVPSYQPPPPPPIARNETDQIYVDITRTKRKLTSVEIYNALWQRTSKNEKLVIKENLDVKGKGKAEEEAPAIAPPHTTRQERTSLSIYQTQGVVHDAGSPEEARTEVDFEDIILSTPRSGTPFTTWEPTPNIQREKDSSPTPALLSPFKPPQVPFSSVPLQPPTPAQRMRKISDSSPISTPGQQHSSNPSISETVLDNKSSSNTRNGIVQQQQQQQRRSITVPRKIPRPASPEPVPKQHTGPARILAPNSDTSGTQQSQSQSQSQSQRGQNKKEVDDCKIEEGIIRDNATQLGIDGGDYPWLDLWRIREIMAKTVEARKRNLDNMSNIT